MWLRCAVGIPKTWVKMHIAPLMPLPISLPIPHHTFVETVTACSSSPVGGWWNSAKNVESRISRFQIIFAL
jgi:hypothetical protein